mmetsp:Transcript_7865/g.22374  ORF Transcript_7865/g.22374 Transcript_7865/m.22374 type:complete len:281 (+) Transcript_7865:982-1824(+)
MRWACLLSLTAHPRTSSTPRSPRPARWILRPTKMTKMTRMPCLISPPLWCWMLAKRRSFPRTSLSPPCPLPWRMPRRRSRHRWARASRGLARVLRTLQSFSEARTPQPPRAPRMQWSRPWLRASLRQRAPRRLRAPPKPMASKRPRMQRRPKTPRKSRPLLPSRLKRRPRQWTSAWRAVLRRSCLAHRSLLMSSRPAPRSLRSDLVRQSRFPQSPSFPNFCLSRPWRLRPAGQARAQPWSAARCLIRSRSQRSPKSQAHWQRPLPRAAAAAAAALLTQGG